MTGQQITAAASTQAAAATSKPSAISIILNEIIYRPILNLLVVLLMITGGNLGLSIILLTIIIRLLMLKPTLGANKYQKQMADIQPKLKEIQQKYKDNPEKLSQETMKLMKEAWGGPLKGCLVMLLQIPVFFGLYYVIRDFSGYQGHSINPDQIYSFLRHFIGDPAIWIQNIQATFLWINLFEKGNLALTIVAWVLMFAQLQLTTLVSSPAQKTKQKLPTGEELPDMSSFMKVMNIFLVLMIAMFVYSTPAAIGLYILTSTLFGLIQYIIQYKALVTAKLKAILAKKK